MKLVNITSVFEKDDQTDKRNYRLISILPNLSNAFPKCIYNQLSVFFDKVFLKYHCGFRKGFSAQHCLIKLLEQWKKSTGQGLVFGALLIDRSLKRIQLSILRVARCYGNVVFLEKKIQQLDLFLINKQNKNKNWQQLQFLKRCSFWRVSRFNFRTSPFQYLSL